jgi:regulator of replication initiation timing
VPEIDKGPLFIRRQKFESAKNMIEEMRYISREIEDVINQLGRGIEEDRETERQAKNLLHKLDEDRTGVKDIISPEKNQ